MQLASVWPWTSSSFDFDPGPSFALGDPAHLTCLLSHLHLNLSFSLPINVLSLIKKFCLCPIAFSFIQPEVWNKESTLIDVLPHHLLGYSSLILDSIFNHDTKTCASHIKSLNFQIEPCLWKCQSIPIRMDYSLVAFSSLLMLHVFFLLWKDLVCVSQFYFIEALLVVLSLIQLLKISSTSVLSSN